MEAPPQIAGRARRWWRNPLVASTLAIGLPAAAPIALGVVVLALAPIAISGAAVGCMPYAILLACSPIAQPWKRPRLAWIVSILPSLILAGVQAAVLFDHVQAVRRPTLTINGHEGSIDPAVITGIALAMTGLATAAAITLWEIAILVTLFVKAARRRKAGVCGHCGYNLAGLGASPRCPECGEAPL